MCNFFSTTTDLTFVYLDTNPAIEESCDYYGASCDEQLDYCVLTCSGPTLPFTILVRFDDEGDKFEPVQNLESNNIQREATAELQLPTVQNFVVPEDNGEDECDDDDDVGSSREISLSLSLSLSLSPSPEGPSLNGKMMLPPGFNSKNKYPVLVYVYGGPNSQQVENSQ